MLAALCSAAIDLKPAGLGITEAVQARLEGSAAPGFSRACHHQSTGINAQAGRGGVFSSTDWAAVLSGPVCSKTTAANLANSTGANALVLPHEASMTDSSVWCVFASAPSRKCYSSSYHAPPAWQSLALRRQANAVPSLLELGRPRLIAHNGVINNFNALSRDAACFPGCDA